MKVLTNSFYILILIVFGNSSFAQTLPVGFSALEDTWRRLQINGESDLNTSFTIRPLQFNTNPNYDSVFNIFGPLDRTNKNVFSFAKEKGIARLLPVTVKQQYNTHHPFGWNDGSMIPAKGYQALLSFGFYSKVGLLTVQLQPELVYAQNSSFSTFPSTQNDSVWKSYYNVLNHIDNPEKYGEGSYTKFFPGQSSVRLNYKKFSLGLSTENLWWGPGSRNSLLMSNNAPGFEHITLNTTAPLMSPIGSFEGQIVSGTLRSSGILPPDTSRMFDGQTLYQPKPNDDRYLNGMIITWQPKWTRGLFLGFSRVYNVNKSDLQHNFNGYLPVIGKFFKNNTSNEDSLKRDQLLSIFFRLILPKEKAELYAEFGRNDHSGNLRDLVLEPEHSRAYIIGLKKIFEAVRNTEIELIAELTNLQLSSTGMVREQPSWYVHHQVRHGYTNLGQVIGAGIGPGGSSQTIGLNWLNGKGIKQFGVMIERVVHNNDFYYDAFTARRDYGSHWVDLSLNFTKNWSYKRFIYTADFSWVRSLNYEWQKKKDVNDVHAAISISYLF